MTKPIGNKGWIAALGMAAALPMAGPGSASAQDVLPVIGLQNLDTMAVDWAFQCLMGGVQNGQFIDADTAAPQLRGGEVVRWLTLEGQQGRAQSQLPYSPDDVCDWMHITDAAPIPQGPITAVGVGGNWDAMPGIVLNSPESVTYRTATAQAMRELGFNVPDQVRLTQVIRVDIDGDGTDEVLVTASNRDLRNQTRVQAGDHSMILLRRVVNGEVITTVIDGEYHEVEREFAAPLEFMVHAVADLNGDGDMEVVLSVDYYEGMAIEVHDVINGQSEIVMGCGCGV